MDLTRKIDITNPVNTGFFYFILFALIVGLSGCDFTGNKVAYTAVVKVNEHELTAKEFADSLARQIKSLDAITAKDPNNLKRIKNEIIKDFILKSLIEDYSKAHDITYTDSELSEEVNKTRSSYPDDLAFRRILAQEGLSLNDWKKSLSTFILTEKLFKQLREKIAPITDQEVKSYIDSNKDRYRRKERILLRQIVTDDLTKANAIHEELLKKKDFVALAKKYSVSPEGKSGGLVGWIEKGSVDIFDKAFSLGVGNISIVLESSYGFHIFKVERKSAAGMVSAEEVKNEVKQLLLAEKEQAEFKSWLDKQIR